MKNSDSSNILPLRESAGDAAPLAPAPRPLLLAPPSDGLAKTPSGSSPPDLRQEAANMLRLALAQEGAGTPLSISSRQAQVVLGRF